MRVGGNIGGIRDSYLETLDGLYDMEIEPGELLSVDILNVLVEITNIIGKEISIFINRRGRVVDVSIGDFSTVSLPFLDYRRGSRRLTGVRCIHTHPNGSGKLSKVDLSALVNLRLDLVSAIGVTDGRVDSIYIGFLKPESGILTESYSISGPYTRESIKTIDVYEEVRNIEKELVTDIPENVSEDERERVLLIGLDLPAGEIPSDRGIPSYRGGSTEDLMDELAELASAAGAEVIGKILQKRNKVDTAYYIGSGKAHELSLIRQSFDIDTIIFDDELSGAQVRNLEDIIGAKVIDRTTLILDIFAKRAQTKEGKLQVELAQLKYMMPRLIGFGKILSRTGGGIGTRGPGEKKLEIDRRHIRERINELEKDLEEIKKNRGVQRERRGTSRNPVISLVGYTNSGKSTLRNTLARMFQPNIPVNKEDVLEADMLFATLDPTTRLIRLPNERDVLISDTVGFIRKLPHNLVDAFSATLEEVVYSDLLIHVIDSSAPNALEQIEAVNNVLRQLDAMNKPIIMALNKIDKISNRDIIKTLNKNCSDTVEISALYGNGINDLLYMVEEKLFKSLKTVLFRVPYESMNVKSSIYNESRVLSEEYDENGVIISAEVDEIALGKYKGYIIEK